MEFKAMSFPVLGRIFGIRENDSEGSGTLSELDKDFARSLKNESKNWSLLLGLWAGLESVRAKIAQDYSGKGNRHGVAYAHFFSVKLFQLIRYFLGEERPSFLGSKSKNDQEPSVEYSIQLMQRLNKIDQELSELFALGTLSENEGEIPLPLLVGLTQLKLDSTNLLKRFERFDRSGIKKGDIKGCVHYFIEELGSTEAAKDLIYSLHDDLSALSSEHNFEIKKSLKTIQNILADKSLPQNNKNDLKWVDEKSIF